MFVPDMVQSQKHRAIKEAAAKALEILKGHLTNTGPHRLGAAADEPSVQSKGKLSHNDSFLFDSKQMDLELPGVVPSR
jgi:hypothetical protein